MLKIPLSDYLKENSQEKAANLIGVHQTAIIGVHQTAISKAIRTGRKIFLIPNKDGRFTAEEHKPFPSNKN
ncbi:MULTISPECIES: Cro/CI family transcriptional regulator [unclassified Arsenophonus]|uniref:Cro/CI family transcriptional regulator n=1 Tax=unclassified Arsenophonus TaxID=2627083 RepID=UPI00285649DA|nr:Cro/CI family transcriptional regulator [Arsenophonus sp.]MDR5611320.1 Cro/CI family transcriptional regulator [Arsenophonus sp.]MDR5615341.1 Cro/CI family transcriptional regulator [Arsenophonus sp.]